MPVIAIYIASKRGGPPQAINSAALEAGCGIVGDRHYLQQQNLLEQPDSERGKEVTLIAAEEVDAFNNTHELHLEYGDLRRNIVTRGIDLNSLVGRHFMIGPIQFRGIELCEPCSLLARRVTPLVLPGLVHRAGLRAAVLTNGILQVGDEHNKKHDI